MSRKPEIVAWLAVPLLLAGLAGCSEPEDDSAVKPADSDASAQVAGDSPSASDTNAEPDPDLPSAEDVSAYMNALMSMDPTVMRDAHKYAEKGTVAYGYVTYYMGVANSGIDQGFEMPAQEVSERDGEYEVCRETDSGEQDCATFSDFEGRDGKIVNFQVNHKDITKRLVIGSGKSVKADSLGATVKLIAAYEVASEDKLAVVFEVASGDQPVNLDLYESIARSKDGRQSKAVDVQGPDSLQANSRSTVILQFKLGKIGADITTEFLSEDFMSRESVTFQTD